jgi:hypothetical protein
MTGALIKGDFLTKESGAEPPLGIQWPATPSTGIFSPAPNGSSGEYGPLLVSGNYLYAAQAGPFWKVYDITTGARYGLPIHGGWRLSKPEFYRKGPEHCSAFSCTRH